MTRPHLACLLVASLVLGAPRTASAFAPAEDATSLAVRADAAHDAGRLGEAADLYARVYRAMTSQEKAALGEIIVVAALEDLRASFRSASDASLSATARALLDEYERDTQSPLPEALAGHRAWIDSARPTSEPQAEVANDDPPARASRHGDDDGRPTREYHDAPRPPPRERDLVAPIAMGIGVATIIAGGVTLGVGAPLGRRAERARDQALADPRYLALDPRAPDTVAYAEGYDDYVQRVNARGKALAAVGSVILAAGIGVAIYGVVRLVRNRRVPNESARIRPTAGGFAF